MHALNLGLQSVASHNWARGIVSRAQRVVTFVNASPPATAAVSRHARALGIKRSLISSNGTRFTSVIRMLQSMDHLQDAVRRAAVDTDSTFKDEVLSTVKDRHFWMDLVALLPIFIPFGNAIMQIQADTANLADVMLHWLRIAAAIADNLSSLDIGQFCFPGNDNVCRFCLHANSQADTYVACSVPNSCGPRVQQALPRDGLSPAAPGLIPGPSVQAADFGEVRLYGADASGECSFPSMS